MTYLSSYLFSGIKIPFTHILKNEKASTRGREAFSLIILTYPIPTVYTTLVHLYRYWPTATHLSFHSTASSADNAFGRAHAGEHLGAEPSFSLL